MVKISVTVDGTPRAPAQQFVHARRWKDERDNPDAHAEENNPHIIKPATAHDQ